MGLSPDNEMVRESGPVGVMLPFTDNPVTYRRVDMASARGQRLAGGVGDVISEEVPLLDEACLSMGEDDEAPSPENMTSQLRSFPADDDPSVPSHGDIVKNPLQSTTNDSDTDSAYLRAQGHEAALNRSFSPLAALGLGFRYLLRPRLGSMGTNQILQHHKLMDGISEYFWTELVLQRATKHRVWAPGCHCGTMDDYLGPL